VPLLLLVLSNAAAAFSPAGYGVPEQGGALAGPAEDGAPGLFTNPAAARADRGSWLIDVGYMYSELYYTLDIDPEFELLSRGASVVPSLAGTEPIGPVGLGFAFMPLYARGGGPGSPEDGSQRFHTIQGGIQLLEFNFDAAVQVHPAWTVGAGFRYGMVSLSSVRAIDAGALIESLAGPDSGAPIGDPFLEGTQSLVGHTGYGVGASFGLRFEPQDGPAVSLSYRTPMDARVEGPLSLVPSNSLAMELTATAETVLPMPGAAFLAVDLPVGPCRVIPELWWIGWGRYYAYQTELSDIEISSDDAYMQSLLESYGLTEADFLQGASEAVSTSGMHDTWVVGLSGQVPVGQKWQGRLGAWTMPGAVPDETVHPGNLDFNSLDLRAALAWSPVEQITLGLGADVYYSPPRVITTSLHSQVDPQPPGALVPSGNGTYKLFLGRAGGTLIINHGPIVKRRAGT